MNEKMKHFFVLIISLFGIMNAHAYQYLQFRHLDMECGLSSNNISGIVQDKQGFIWIGTNEGLDRFDGTKVYPFKLSYDVTRYKASNTVIIMGIDSEGNIWVSSGMENYVFSTMTGLFSRFDTETAKGQKLPFDVRNVAEDHNKKLWFSTHTHGIFCYDLRTRKLTSYTLPMGTEVNVLIVDKNNQIWAATAGNQAPLFKYNRPRNIFEPVDVTSGDVFNKDPIRSLYESKSGTIYCATWDHGLFEFDRMSHKAMPVLYNCINTPLTHIHAMRSDNNGNLWIGSDDGLVLLNTRTGETHLYNKDIKSQTALSDKFIYNILQDYEGGLWIGTFYGGVNYAKPYQDRFKAYDAYSEKNLKGEVIAGFCEDNKEMIWISSDDGGLARLDPKTGDITAINKSNSGLSTNNTHALYADGDNIWIGTYSGGVCKYNTATRQWKQYYAGKDPNTLFDSNCYAIEKDSRGTLYVCNMTGICKYNYATDDFTRIRATPRIISAIEEDRNRNMWFSSPGGELLKYSPDSKKWKSYDCANSKLPSNEISALHLDDNGTLWLGTSKGLCRYDERSDNFIAEPLNAPNQNIQCILEQNGQLWITTTNGLVCHTPEKNQDRLFTRGDGLVSAQFSMNSGIVASDGRIYIGSDKGFNSFFPDQIKRNNYVAPVVITNILLMNKDIDEVKKGKIKQAIPLLKKLDLNYDDNIITLNFASLSYCIPEKNEYTYYLEGFDKNWVKAGNRQSATYTNLSPGTYVFHVKGANNDGVWNNQEATLTIVVHPPFYSTWWAKLLYILMLGGISWAAWNIYKKRMEEEQQIRIDRVKQEKEKELYTSKITFFTMIAHEIRTPVSLIIGPLEKILNKALDDSLRSDLQTVQRNGNRLLFLVNQLLDFRKVQQNMFKMHFTHNDIIPLIHATATRFKPWVEQRGATITINATEKEIMVDFDYEAVTKILSNLLTNAAKYTTDKVIVSCKSDAESKRVIISVEDNGTGIAEEEKQKIFRPFYQCESNKPGTGIGLTIVRNMVELHQGTVSVTSTPGKGSTFTVSLPLHQDKVDTTPGETTDINTLPTDIIPTQDTISQPKDDKPMLLIVDDNEEMLTFLSQTFVNDYTIMTALNGQQALKLVEDNNFQLIISDWMMPVMDGAQLCKKIRSNSMTSHIPFILLTAKTDLDSKIESMDIGADVFVEKPFSVHYLKSCIHNLISQRNMLIQKFSTMPLVPIKTIASHSEDERLLNKINEIIEENFSNPDLDVDFLASRMNLSRSSLYLKIKNVTDRTPNELIQLLRLKKAALLLAENKYRMNEICYMIGFSSPGYFSKCFFKQFGVRPSEYVNANNANGHE